MARLSIPNDARCLVPGCRCEVTHVFSMRMRRLDTGADWAPNSTAYFCTPHADDGALVTVFYEPNKTGFVDIAVSVISKIARRETRITKRMGVRLR
jgi:hypothetical protein